MKKILSLVIVALMLCGTMALAASADSYNYNGPMDLEFSVKKANAANVVKDGKIGAGEYERLDIDNDPESEGCEFWVGYSDAECFDYAEEMLKTVEYYFSWDETHGFNFAVRFKPHEIKQVLEVKPGDVPMDYFLQNTGIGFEMNSKNRDNATWDGELYHAIAKRTDTGAYLNGWYSQRGLKGYYSPVAGQDYIIEYSADGYVTCEWSVPFDNVIAGTVGDGTSIYFNISVTSGLRDTIDHSNDDDFWGTYVVGLGNRTYYCKQTNDSTYAVAVLSDEVIPGDSQPVIDNPTDPTDPTNPDNPVVTDPTNPDNPVIDPISGEPVNDNPSVKTGDVVVVLAAVSAVSAAGAFFSKKRRG